MGAAAMEHAGAGIDEIAYLDLYSCFPSAVQIAARELGLPTDDPARPPTVTGGLTFAGGPGNNYSSHGIATLVHRLRADPDALALGTALGWYATKHACGILSGRPPRRPYREIDADDLIDRPPKRSSRSGYDGAATLEAYTVPYGRDGEPEAAIVSALTPDGDRALVRTADRELIAALLADGHHGHGVTFAGGGVEL
jgi:acetyl-CoA C-acetyltransferase